MKLPVGKTFSPALHLTNNNNEVAPLLPCQPRVTVTSCFVYKVIMDLESKDHLCINPIRISLSGVYKLIFYLTIVNKTRRHCHSWLAGQYNMCIVYCRHPEPGH